MGKITSFVCFLSHVLRVGRPALRQTSKPIYFATNLAVNGIANNVGLKFEQLPIFRASGRPLVQFGKKVFKQGINSSADKMKNTYYSLLVLTIWELRKILPNKLKQ